MASSKLPRVLGWDVLRGLTALGVMAYHLLYWQGLAELSTLGTYGVYLFFTLAGASLAYAYPVGTLASWRAYGAFLVARWLRLAPLYLALVAVYLTMLRANNGNWMEHLPKNLALNASFTFGLFDPATSALLIGGWSLGIEFVFYLLMPVFAWALTRRKGRWFLLAVLGGVQAAWVLSTVGESGLAKASVAYHQVPAFSAYFFAGCLIGHARRQSAPAAPLGRGLAVWALITGLLLACVPEVPGQELVSWRGLLLPLACVLTVWASGAVLVPVRLQSVSAWLGDITYGTYLLHPLLLFGLSWFILPAITDTPIESLPTLARVLLALGIGTLACLLAAASERWYERPFRQSGRRLVQRVAGHSAGSGLPA